MADTPTSGECSRPCTRIRGRGALIDLKSEKLQARSGARFKTHPKMTGSPDFAGWCRKIAVFSDGNFWYGYK